VVAPEKLLSPAFLKTISRLDLRARFIVEGFLAGLHRSPARGFSVEFSDYRDYVPGDDVSHIDWRLYARTDRFYVKRFEAETNLRCVLVADASASMDWSSDARLPTKLEYAVSLAASLGVLLIRQGDRVGLGIIDERLRRWVPPKSKRSHLAVLLTELLRVQASSRLECESGRLRRRGAQISEQAPTCAARSPGRTRRITDLAASLRDVSRIWGKRALVVILSDLLDEPEPVIRELRRLRFQGHDVIVFHILDPAERRGPRDGANLFEDPETGLEVAAELSGARPSYVRAVESLIGQYRAACGPERIDYVLADTSTSFDRCLLRFLDFRAK
jgi:uncharacterized protein (DUF58 family)